MAFFTAWDEVLFSFPSTRNWESMGHVFFFFPLGATQAHPRFSRFRVPRAYWAVLAAPLATWELCWVFAITQSGAPIPAVLWVFRRRVAILSLDLIAIKLMVLVCDYFAQPSRLNCVKTSCIWAGLALFLFILWQSWFLLDAAGFISASVASSVIVVTAVLFVGEVWVDLTSLCRGRWFTLVDLYRRVTSLREVAGSVVSKTSIRRMICWCGRNTNNYTVNDT